MDLLLPWVAALVAILIVPGWSFYFDVTPKVLVVLAGAALAVLFLQWPGSGSQRFKWFLRIVAVQAAAILLGTAFSTHRWVSLYGSTWRRSGLFVELAVLVLAVAGAAEAKDVRGWLRITVMASIPVALYAICQYFGVDPILSGAGYHFGEGKYMIVRPPATLGHAAYLATYLLYAIFAGAELARRETTRGWRITAVVASGLAFFAMVLSGTRAALVGLAVGILWMAMRDRIPRKIVYAAGALILVIVGFYASPLGERLRARVFWSSEDPLGGSRLTLWRDTARMAVDRPVTGYGPETFSLEFPRHQSLELARAYPDFYHESPHNMFLDALVSNGVLGLIATIALAVFGVSIARGFMGAGFIGMLAAQQFTAFTLPTEIYFYLTVILLMTDAKTQAVPARIRTIQAALAACFAGFAIYLGTGDFLLASARRALDEHNADRAAELVDRARWWSASADYYFSRRFAATTAADPVERLRVWQYGFKAAMHAPDTADDPQNALLNLAVFQANLNDAAGVERSLRGAITAAPEWFKPHWLLAQVMEQQGRPTEALSEAQAAVDRAGGKHPEVIATLQRLRVR